MKKSNLPVCCLGLLALLMPGCFHTSEEIQISQVAGPKLDAKSIVYVGIPPDAYYKKDLAVDSGRQAAALVRDACARYARQAYIGRDVETFAQALETARRSKCTYLVYPTLLAWEDHATEYSGVRDKAEVKMEAADVKSGELLHSIVIKGASRWLSPGGDTPGDALIEPIGKYIASLFQVNRTPTALEK